MFSSRPQARAREGHQSELQELLERWQQEKAETEREHEKQLLDMEQKVAAVQAQQQEEQTRRENAEREVKAEKGEVVCFCEAGAVGDGWGWGCVEHPYVFPALNLGGERCAGPALGLGTRPLMGSQTEMCDLWF